MSGRLQFPELVERTRRCESIEINVDGIDEVQNGKWRALVQDFANNWLCKNKLSKSATIWTYGQTSADFQPAFASNWSQFVVQFGLPSKFQSALFQRLCKRYGHEFFRVEYVDFEIGSWEPVCHIEQGLAWKRKDTDIWAPVDDGTRAPLRTSESQEQTAQTESEADDARLNRLKPRRARVARDADW